MALLKDLIVQGASRFIGDAYFATIKAGVWNGTPIDLSHGGTAGETTAGKILTSTTTSGTSAWTAASNITVGTATTATKLSTVSKTAWGLTYWTSGGVPDSISGAMSSVTNIDSLLYFDTTNSRIGIGNDSPVDKLDVDGKVIIYPKGIDNSTLKANLIIKLQNSTEDSGDNWGGTKPSFGILFNRFWTSNSNAYGETACAGIFATVSSSWRGGLLFRTKNNQTLGGTHDIDALRLSPSGAAYFSGVVSARSKVLAELNATTTTAGLVFVSTTTEGRGEWYTGVTIAQLKSVSDWYDTVKDTDTDANINRWNEIVDFLNNFTEADTLASVLSTYVTLGTAQTITGAKTFSNPISGDLLGNATTADRLKSTTAVGGAGTPVYFTGGLPVACTAANVRTFLGLGTVYSHAHTDYVTNVSYDSSTRMLLQSKGGATATDVVNVTNVYLSRTNASTDYRPLVYGKASGTYNSADLYADLTGQVYTSNTISAKSGPGYLYVAGNISINENPDTYGATNKLFVNGSACIADSTYANLLEIWRKADGSFSCIRYSNGASTKTVLGLIGISAGSDNLVKPNRPYWSTGDATPVYYLLVHSTGKTQIGSGTQPVYIDANGQAQVCTAYSSASASYATSAGQVKTTTRSTNATHYLTFVDSDNSTATAESIYTDAGITYNPSTNLLTIEKLTASGVVNLSGSTTIDSLTAGNLTVTGASTLTGNVSMGTITAGTWNGSVIDVAHGGTGCSTLTSGSALIGNGTGAVTFKAIDTTVTANSSNLITSGAVATYVTTTLAVSPTISKTSITKSLNSSTWTETGYTLYGESQGSYMLQITDTTTAAVFTGVFSIYNSSSATGNDLDEIPLHMCASATNKVRIYAATLNGKLLVSSQDASATNHALTIKYKKII